MATNPTSNAAASLAAFSTDVEDYFQVESLRGLCPRSEWERFEDRTVDNTLRVLDLLDRHGARGTFFVLGWTADRHPNLVRRIAQAGHEVASHGYAHELVYNQSPEVFREDVRRTRKLLQDLSGQEVIGYRAPSYTVVKRTWWALGVLAEEGYRYDSSVFPIRRRRYGMPDAPRWPHRVELNGSGYDTGGAAGGGADGSQLSAGVGSIAEFPLPTVRMGGVNVPATGGAYLRLLPFGFQRWALRRMLDAERPFVLTIHPWELDPAQPRLPVGMRTRWTHYHNLDQTERRLDGLLQLAAYRSQAEVLESLGLLAPDQPALSSARR